MFAPNKHLQDTVRVSEPNPALAKLMLEQLGGAQGELAAAMRYFTQAVSEDDPGRKDMLLDIATEELCHLETIGDMSTPRTGAERGMSMQSAGGGTMAASSSDAMGQASGAGKGGPLDDTGMGKQGGKGTAMAAKAMKE